MDEETEKLRVECCCESHRGLDDPTADLNENELAMDGKATTNARTTARPFDVHMQTAQRSKNNVLMLVVDGVELYSPFTTTPPSVN